MSVILPENYKEKMKELLKDEYQDYLDSFDSERVYGLRVNTNKISVEDFLKIAPYKVEKIDWISNGFYYDGNDPYSKHPYYYAGLYYLQEPSAMTPAEYLPIEKGDKVFDGCSAPGGKATELANKLNGTGLLVCNDISASRCQGLLKNIELAGVSNSFVISEDVTKLDKKFEGYFDKILLDVPCSGEGMFRKDAGLIKSYVERGCDYYSSIQKPIAYSAVKMLKQGGMMMYSTCTFDKSEDEDVIEYLLEQFDDLKVIDMHLDKDYLVNGASENTKLARKLYPHKLKGEGHFVCLLQKGEKKDSNRKSLRVNSVPKEAEEFFKDVNFNFEDGSFEVRNDKLYFIRNTELDFKGIRIIRSGLLLGEIKKGRFEPAQTFGLAMKKSDYKYVVDLPVSDTRVMKYLKGETLEFNDLNINRNGYVLVCVDGYSLGFGKLANGILKNKNEAKFRWQ